MRLLFLFISTILLASGCIDLLPSKSNNPNAVVVNCLLNDDDVQKLKLTRTTKVENLDGFEIIADAKISLNEVSETGTFLAGEFVYKGGGEYTLDYRPKPGSRYRLNVLTPQSESLFAETQMPEAIPVVPFDIMKMAHDWSNFKREGLIPDFIFFNLSKITAAIMYILQEAPIKNALSVSQLNSEIIHSDILTSIPLHYKLKPQIYATCSNDFSDKFNKIKPTDSTDIRYWFYYVLRIFEKREIYGGDWKTLGVGGQDSTGMVAFSIKTLSAEYLSYIKSVMTKAWTYQDETGLSSMFDISNIYTNISGGYGIFGAFSEELIFYNRGKFVNLYFAQSRKNILRGDITEFMKNIPWEKYNMAHSLDYLINYIKWLNSEK